MKIVPYGAEDVVASPSKNLIGNLIRLGRKLSEIKTKFGKK